MIIPHHMTGKTFAILGCGRSGISACDALLVAGATCYIHDDQMMPDHVPADAIISTPDQWPWDNLEALIMSPGIPHYILPRIRRQNRRRQGKFLSLAISNCLCIPMSRQGSLALPEPMVNPPQRL